jgi:hypothetical protein
MAKFGPFAALAKTRPAPYNIGHGIHLRSLSPIGIEAVGKHGSLE